MSDVRAFVESLWFITEGLARVDAEYIGVGDYAGWRTIKVINNVTEQEMRIIGFDGRIFMEIVPEEVSGRNGYNVYHKPRTYTYTEPKVCRQCNIESDSLEWKFDDICRACSLGNMVSFVEAVVPE